MVRSAAVSAVIAVLISLGLPDNAAAQERAKLVGTASCIDADGKYTITWTLTLALADGETATAETEMSDFEGLDLIGQPQEDGYPFQAEAGNIFTSAAGRLVNGENVARTQMDTRVYDPDVLTAHGRIVATGGSTDVEVAVYRPQRCAA
jgi:hypothetical protein